MALMRYHKIAFQEVEAEPHKDLINILVYVEICRIVSFVFPKPLVGNHFHDF